jgi:hypothetical protein
VEIIQIYVVKKGLTRTGNNVIRDVLQHIECDAPLKLNILPTVSIGDTFYINIENLPENLIPLKTFKSSKRIPEKFQVDFLIVLNFNGFTSEPIRFKQPNPNGKNKDKRVRFIIPNIQWAYKVRTISEMVQWYEQTENEGFSGFNNLEDFANWYKTNVEDGTCGYCGLTERECQEIVHKGLLTSLRFPIYKNTSQGVNRGYWLEIDRRNPIGLYSRENCIPSCYFCNNDKSDVFTEQQYREFVADRLGFLRRLIDQNQE